MTRAHETIQVPDYSNRPHSQTVEVRADQLEKGDYIVVPNNTQSSWNPHDEVKGPVFEVNVSTTCLKPPGWLIMSFGATMMKWVVDPSETFHKRVPHDPQTCRVCIGIFTHSRRNAGLPDESTTYRPALTDEALARIDAIVRLQELGE
jgi:hypothetical protein